MKIGIVAFSEKGFLLGARLAEYYASNSCDVDVTRCKDGSLGVWTEAHFALDDALIFVGSAGIAVRAIAPNVKRKITDPAVVVVDELATYSISLLAGHLGGANELATEIAQLLDAIPVVTTATDLNGIFAVDNWAKKQGLIIVNPDRIKWVSSRLLAGETVKFKSNFPVEDAPPKGIELTDGPSDERHFSDLAHTRENRGATACATCGHARRGLQKGYGRGGHRSCVFARACENQLPPCRR